jgi:hypothetical protein
MVDTKGYFKSVAKKVKQRLIDDPWPEVPFDNSYSWLGYAFQELMKDPSAARKPMYCWGVLQGAALARVLGYSRICVIEFGVAGGAGLLAMEHIALAVEPQTQVQIDVFGFDTGAGLPKPIDYRDQPNMWFEGQLPMKQAELKSRLHKAKLQIGNVTHTIPEFLTSDPAPVAFVCFDLDLYSSTRDALQLFWAPYERLLPRVICYFDDIMGHSYSDFTGERLAIQEFNDVESLRKLSPIYNLQLFVPRAFRHGWWWSPLYFAHFFDHPQYNQQDSIRKAVYTDHMGYDLRSEPQSDWRQTI